MSLEEMMLADAAAEKPKSELDRARDMAKLLLTQKARVTELENSLVEAKEAVSVTETIDLPLLLKEIGLPEFKDEFGNKFELISSVNCGITEERSEEAHRWLNEHGFGGLIKTMVVVAFASGAEEKEKAYALYEELLNERELENTIIQEKVHPATLKSFVKEQLEKESTFESESEEDPEAEQEPRIVLPRELFGVFIRDVVKVSVEKPKKGPVRKGRQAKYDEALSKE